MQFVKRGESRGGFPEEIISEYLKKEEDSYKPCVCAAVVCVHVCVCTWWVNTVFQEEQLDIMMSPGCGGQRDAASDSHSMKDALPQL